MSQTLDSTTWIRARDPDPLATGAPYRSWSDILGNALVPPLSGSRTTNNACPKRNIVLLPFHFLTACGFRARFSKTKVRQGHLYCSTSDGSAENKPVPHHIQKTTAMDGRYIILQVKRARYQSAGAIAQQLCTTTGQQVSWFTVARPS
ncbi:hypothetical protein TNCV_3260181 [Trichonephila clavipes]|nr:hypothetical protein TNCV_3260181 [Trichonephila clavipes]